MFEDVAEMEREIETFRKNVVASSELVEGVSQLIVETKKQRESFSVSTEELLNKLNSCIEQIKNDHEVALRTLSDSNNSAIEGLQKNMSAEQQTRIEELERIQTELRKALADATAQADAQVKQLNMDCEQILAEAKSTLETCQNAYIEKLQDAESVIRGYQSTAESKYAEFVKRLEMTNVDQIFKEVQDLKKSIQTRFAILAGGIGVTLILVVGGLFF